MDVVCLNEHDLAIIVLQLDYRHIEALQGSLDMARGGLLAANLNDLYDYMLRRLGHAASAGDAGPLAEVAGLLDTIREGWAAIAPEVEASTA